MKTNHKPKKAGSGKKTHKKGHRKGKGKRKGLSGPNAGRAKSLGEAFAETGKQAGGTALGVVVSAVVGYGIDQIGFMQPKEGENKVLSIVKKAVKPTVLIGGGLALGTFARSKGAKMNFVAAISDGITAGGAYSGIKAIVGDKTKIFSGLGNAGADNTQYYTENLKEFAKILKENGTAVELKGYLEEGERMPARSTELGAPVIIPGTQLRISNSNMIL